MVEDQLEQNAISESDDVADVEENNKVEKSPEGGAEAIIEALGNQKIIDQLQAELDSARAQADEYLDGWQRARAEFANYKKRIERDQVQIYQTTTGSIIKRYLDIIDDLDLALKNRPQDGDGASWANGIEMIYRKLLTILENEGLTPIEADGQFFDPNLHEALSSEPSEDHESGQIIEVIKRGYLLGDRVLRPALVRVAQ
jgi:molecular chaperone GrpE